MKAASGPISTAMKKPSKPCSVPSRRPATNRVPRVAISLDIAASEFGKNGVYTLAKDDKTLQRDEMCAMMIDWMERYPIVSIEDPLGEDDPDGLIKFTWAVGDNAQVVGDDVLVTNAARVTAAAKDKLCNTLLCKPNQAGTLTEAKAAFDAAAKAGMGRDCVGTLRRDRRCDHRAYGHRLGGTAIEGRLVRTVGTYGEVERRYPHRRPPRR